MSAAIDSGRSLALEQLGLVTFVSRASAYFTILLSFGHNIFGRSTADISQAYRKSRIVG